MKIIYEDNHIIAVNKNVGDIVQGDKTGDVPLSDLVKQYIKEKPIKRGYKVWVLTDTSTSYIYDFEIYSVRR